MTKFDIQDGYYNIKIKPEDRWKAAFKTPFGLFEPNVMPFGLTNTPAAFQKFMDHILASPKRKYPQYLFGSWMTLSSPPLMTRNSMKK
jgi:hypothetical protein